MQIRANIDIRKLPTRDCLAAVGSICTTDSTAEPEKLRQRAMMAKPTAICSTDRTYSCQAVTCGQFSDIDVCSNLHWQNFCSKVSSWVMAWFAYLDSRGWRDSTIAVCLGSSALGISKFRCVKPVRALINLPLFLSCLVEMLGEK